MLLPAMADEAAAIVRPDGGLAASPLVGYNLEMQRRPFVAGRATIVAA